MKALTITGLVIAGLSLVCMLAWQDSDPDSALGWGIINVAFSIAVYITMLVNLRRQHTRTLEERLEQIEKQQSQRNSA